MTVGDRPLILVGELAQLATLPGAALADVIVTTSGRRRPAQLCDSLFAAYPGLTFILIVGNDATVHLGSRDGRMLLVRTERPVSFRSPWLRALALAVHAERVRRARPAAAHVAWRRSRRFGQ